MQKKLSWEVFSKDDRNNAIEAIKHTISDGDGCIMNFSMFSDLALTISVEIEEEKIQKLYKAFSLVATMSADLPSDINQQSKKEWIIFLSISFIKGTGELKQQIPEVPG